MPNTLMEKLTSNRYKILKILYENQVKKADGTTVSGLQVPEFDRGSEQGFMGLNVHGNMHMSGKLNIFSFNCTGNGAGRC